MHNTADAPTPPPCEAAITTKRAHLKLAASLSQRRCHHHRVSALCSAARAVTLAWKRAICRSSIVVSHSAGESWYWLKPKGMRAGMRAVSTCRMAVLLACLGAGWRKQQRQQEGCSRGVVCVLCVWCV